MDELHENEQHFFNPKTLAHLADFVEQFQTPLCLYALMLRRALQLREREVAIFDSDDRFADLSKVCRFDVFRPTWIDEQFYLIVCDPPFFKVSLS